MYNTVTPKQILVPCRNKIVWGFFTNPPPKISGMSLVQWENYLATYARRSYSPVAHRRSSLMHREKSAKLCFLFPSSTMTVWHTHRKPDKGHSLVSTNNHQLWPCWGNAVMVLIKTVPGVKSGPQSKMSTVYRDQGRKKALAATQQRLPLTSTNWPLSGCGRSQLILVL